MPRQIFIGLPDAGARGSILRIVLSRERVADDVDYGRIAGLTDGYSGSDLKEVIRAAALAPIREAYRKEAEAARAGGARGGAVITPRPITTADLLEAVRTVKPTGQAARDYLSFQRNTVTSFSTASAAAATPPAPPAPMPHAAPPMAAVATGVPITGAVAAATRGPPSTPKTPGPRGGSPGDGFLGAASPSASGSHVEYTFGPSAKTNGLNLARAIEDVTKQSHKASYAQAAEAGKKAVVALSSRPTTPAKQPVARSLAASGLEGIL
jgi:hypothetical protein